MDERKYNRPKGWESESDADFAKEKEQRARRWTLTGPKKKQKDKRQVENWDGSCSCTSYSSDDCSCDCCCSSISCSSDSDDRFSRYYRLSSDEEDLRGVNLPKESKKKRRGMTKLLLHTFTMWDDIWRSKEGDSDESSDSDYTGDDEYSDDDGPSDNYRGRHAKKSKNKKNRDSGSEDSGGGKGGLHGISLSDVALSKRLKQTLMLRQEHGVFFSGKWYGAPVEELDPFIYADTFCVLSYRPSGPCVAYRYYKGESLGLFPPDHPVRLFAFRVVTHRYFQKIITLTIFANCVTLAMERFDYDEYGKRYETPMDLIVAIIEMCFLGVYTIEMFLKIIAKGFVFQKMSYLRNGWNMLDFFVVTSNYFSLMLELTTTNEFDMEFNGTNYEFLRIFRVIRIVKAINILPGLRRIVTALLKSSKNLLEVLSLTLFTMMFFSLLGMEFFAGKFRNKCVRIKGYNTGDNFVPDNTVITKGLSAYMIDRLYGMWVEDDHNWLFRDSPDSEPIPCGNGTTARKCPEGFICLEVANSMNPNNGWISFDNFFLAMFQTLQTMTSDYWERIYELALSTVGWESTIYFVITIFFGGFYLINLMLAVVTQAYDKDQKSIDVNKKQREIPVPKFLQLTRQMSNFKFEHLNQHRLHLFEGFHEKSQRERDVMLLRMIKASEFAHPKMDLGQFQLSQQFSHAIYNFLGKLGRYKAVKKWAQAEKEVTEHLNLHRTPIPDDGYYDEFMLFDGCSDAELVNEKDPNCLLLENGRKCNFGLSGFDKTFLVPNKSRFVQRPVQEPEFELFPRINKWESIQATLDLWSVSVKPFVEDWKWKNLMVLCIFVNTVVSSLEYFDQPYWLDWFIHWSNEVFTYVFCFELLLKVIAYQKRFFEYGWNKFDL